MSDEKALNGAARTSTKIDGIPVPITANLPTRSRSRRAIRFIAILLVLVSFHAGLQRFYHSSSFQQDVERHHHHHHHHHKHRLTGKAAEKYFLEVPNEESCIQASRHYTSEPHRAGSDGDLKTAKDFLALLQDQLGIEPPSEIPIYPAGSVKSRHATLMIPKSPVPYAWIDTYYPTLNTPLDRNLQALDDDGNVIWEADLEEHADPADPEAAKYSEAVPAFHGLSKSGDVSGKLVYANYGMKEDYDALVEKGVNLTGAIVLARYGGNFRGIKIQRAQQLGAVGVLIYSDVRDDGAVTVENGYEPYPYGPARAKNAVQRGSVQFLSLYPGDPTTPGYPAYENSTRTEGLNKPKIPSLPISSENAAKLMELAKGDWNGTIRLNNQVEEKVMPIWNTMAIIPGYIKDEVVVIGNHRDAWVMGAADPTSGTASLHETIRGFGALMKKGWKPLRTILIASWDAEEYGLVGSTEYGEDFADFIDKYVVAYLNLDSAASGSQFHAQASPSLAHLVYGAALDVPHPTEQGKTLWDATNDTGNFFGAREDGVSVLDAEAVAIYEASKSAQDTIGVTALGSGSDYTVFLQRIGVASMNHGFSGTQTDAVYHYHSVYDSERWEEMYADPGFHRHVAVAKHLGLVAMRLASPVVLPLNTTHYAFEIENYLDKVENAASLASFDLDLAPLRSSIHSLQSASQALDYEKLVAERELRKILKKWRKKGSRLRKLRRKARKAYCKFQKKVFGKECKSHHHHHHHSSNEDKLTSGSPDVYTHVPRHLPSGKKPRVGRFPAWKQEQQEKEDMEMMYGLAVHAGYEVPSFGEHGCAGAADLPRLPFGKLRRVIKRLRAVNQKLVAFERGFISEDGLPLREWYRHLGVAPGRWLGYGATTLPALTESITIDNNSTQAKYEAERLQTLVDKLVETIRVNESRTGGKL